MRRLTIVFIVIAFLLSGICCADPSGEAAWAPGKGGELLKSYGFITGGTGGDLMLNSYLTREQLAIILCELHGMRSEAAAYAKQPNYPDARRISSWARSYVAFCQDKGWMVGMGGMFNPGGYVGGEQLSAAVLRVLGYTDVEWGGGVAFMRSLGVELSNARVLTRSNVFDALWHVVSMPIMKSGEVLGEVTGRLRDATAPFAVTSVRSDNYGYIYVEFNKAIDPSTVSPSSIVLKRIGKDGTAAEKGVEFSSVRTVRNGAYFIPTLLFSEMEAQLEISGIKPLWAKDSEISYSERITISDKTAPNFLGIEFAGERALTLVFDEPVSKTGNIQLKLKNAIIGISSDGVSGIGTDRLTYSVNTTFIEGRTYGVETSYFKDLVGNSSARTYHERVYAPELTAPEVRIGEQRREHIELIFSRRVTGIEPNRFYLGDNTNKPIRITATSNYNDKSVERTDYVERVYLWFYDATVPGSKVVPQTETMLYIDGRMILDGFKNQLSAGSFAVKAP